MKNTLIVNLFGGAGIGKSTLMARIFSELKVQGYDCEMVTEFAKDLVWEKRTETFKDELYIFAKQNHRLFRVNGIDYYMFNNNDLTNIMEVIKSHVDK